MWQVIVNNRLTFYVLKQKYNIRKITLKVSGINVYRVLHLADLLYSCLQLLSNINKLRRPTRDIRFTNDDDDYILFTDN